jgi:hypothetical protein
VGYVLGFRHLTFYANGRVGWLEELVVREKYRGAAWAGHLPLQIWHPAAPDTRIIFNLTAN